MFICRFSYILGYTMCSESICHFSVFPKAKEKKTTKQKQNTSLLSLEVLFFDLQNCSISLSSSLNVSFISFPSAKSDSCSLKQQSLKPLSGMTFFSSIPHVLTVPECRLDILLDPHCHFKIISVLSSLKNPDF